MQVIPEILYHGTDEDYSIEEFNQAEKYDEDNFIWLATTREQAEDYGEYVHAAKVAVTNLLDLSDIDLSSDLCTDTATGPKFTKAFLSLLEKINISKNDKYKNLDFWYNLADRIRLSDPAIHSWAGSGWNDIYIFDIVKSPAFFKIVKELNDMDAIKCLDDSGETYGVVSADQITWIN